MRQFISVKFRPDLPKSYVYHNEGDPLKVGDVVKVAARDGDGWQKATVVGVNLDAPSFATKPIIGLFVRGAVG